MLLERGEELGALGSAAADAAGGRAYGSVPRAHVRAADALSAWGAAPEVVAAHLLKAPAGADPLAVQRLRRAASVATARGSAEAALAYLPRCLDEDLDPPVRAAVLAEAAELAVQVDLPAAVGLLDEAVRSSTDPVAAARLGLLAGNARGYLLDPEGEYAALAAARDRLPVGEADLRRRIEATLLVAPGRAVPAVRVATLAALPPADGVGARMLPPPWPHTRWRGAIRRARPGPVRRWPTARWSGSSNGEGALVCGWLTLTAADDPLALSSLDAAVAQAHRNGSLPALSAA